MKICIFETEHYEGAFPVIKLFDMPGNELVIFTDAATYKMFADLFGERMSRYQWVVLNKDKRLQYFRRLYQAARAHKPEIFYLNTISNNQLLYALVLALLPATRFVLTLHDLNCMLNSRWSWQPKQLLHHLGKKALIKLVKELNVISDTMIPYLQQQTKGKKKIHNVPGAVFEMDQAQLTITDHIHLVVSGTIDKKRRNYEHVFQLLQLAEQKKLPVHVTILGGCKDEYGRAVLQKAKSFSTAHTRLTVYDTGVVYQDEFDRQLNKAHFIFNPSDPQTAICFDIPETYGVTKTSGTVFDAIKHARPFIAPATLQVPAALNNSCFKYDGLPALVDFLAGLMQQKAHYQHWQQQALAGSTAYIVQKVRERNASLFEVAPKQDRLLRE